MSLAQLLIEGGFRATAASRITSTVYAGPDATARIGLDGNAATGNFQVSLSPANLTASRRWTFPDADSTVAGLSVANAFTAANSFTQQITSSLATGTAPFSIASTTVVGNLNVSQLLGGTWAIPGSIGSTTPNTGTFTTITASGASQFNGTVTVGSNTTAQDSFINGAAGTGRNVYFETAGLKRWIIQAGPTAEGGSNAGTELRIGAYDDSGSFVDLPLIITRITGGAFTVSRPTAVTSTTSASSATVGAFTVGNGTAATSVAIGGGKINCGDSLTAGASSSIAKSAVSATVSLTIQNTGGGAGSSSALFLDDGTSHLFQIVPDNNGTLTSIKAINRNTEMDFWTGTGVGASRFKIDPTGLGTFKSTIDATALATASWIFSGGVVSTKNIIHAQGRGAGFATNATVAGTITLTSASKEIQTFTGVTAGTIIQMPAANALGANISLLYTINNQSTQTVTPTRAGSDTFQGGGTTDPVLTGATTRYASDGVSLWMKV